MSFERSGESPEAIEGEVRRLHLGRWETVRHRLLPRLVPRGRAGPLGRELPEAAIAAAGGAEGRDQEIPVVADIGVDLRGGIVRIDDRLASAWGVEHHTIWRAATANLDRRDQPSVVLLHHGAVRLRVLSGDVWTTGDLLRPWRLSAAWPAPPSHPSHGVAGTGQASGPILAVAPQPELVILGDPVGPTSAADPLAELADTLLRAAADLAAPDRAGRLPVVVLSLTGSGSFPARWILE